jgi:hypothetical protein
LVIFERYAEILLKKDEDGGVVCVGNNSAQNLNDISLIFPFSDLIWFFSLLGAHVGRSDNDLARASIRPNVPSDPVDQLGVLPFTVHLKLLRLAR